MSKKLIEHKPTRVLLSQILSQLEISAMAEQYLQAKKLEGVSPGALDNYHRVLKTFIRFCETLIISEVEQVSVDTIRKFLTYLEESGHNSGGIHHYYRGLRTFFNWVELEEEIENWKNPFKTGRLKPPKLDEVPLEPVKDDVIKKMLAACDTSLKGLRDKAIIIILVDTGIRAQELYNILIEDVNFIQRSILITRGKGGKPRPVFFSKKAKKALLAYLKQKEDHHPNLFTTIRFRGRECEPLNYSALRDIMRDISKKANVETPKIHGFRRYFALSMLKAGCDVFTLQRLMGHADLQVLRRYLKQNTADLKAVYDSISPMDNLFNKRLFDL